MPRQIQKNTGHFVFSSLTDLRALSGENLSRGQPVFYTSSESSDGTERIYVWNTTSTDSDDGDITIKLTDTTTGRLKAIKYDGSLVTGSQYFATVADLIASETVTIGDHVVTNEYSTGNGGGNRYEIVAAGTGTNDGGSYINLSGSGLQAKSLSPNLTAEQFGAIGDDSTNNTTAVQKAAAACNGVLRFGAGTFKMNVIGIQGVVVVGAGMGRTIIKAFSSGTGFILDSQLNTDGVTTNTNGLFGGAKSLLIDGDLKGYDGVRTYGGFATLEDLYITGCVNAYDIGLPIAMQMHRCYAVSNTGVGFHTFSGAGDIATSLTVTSCWSDSNALKNWHIEQLTYSSFIDCSSQNVPSAGIGWHLEGSTNGAGFGTSLSLINCASEGDLGDPFLFKNQRALSIIAPKLVSPPTDRDLMTFDNASGVVMNYQEPTPGVGFYGLRNINSTDSSGAVSLIGGEITMNDAEAQTVCVFGTSLNGRRQATVSGNATGRTESPSGLGVTEDDYSGITTLCGRARFTTFNPTSTITGLINGVNGREIHIQNISSANDIVLKHEGASSTAGNRFYLPSSSDVTLSPYESAVIVYDGTLARWIMKSN